MLKVMVIVDFGSCMDEENHVLVRSAFIHELKNHKSDYFPIFGTEMRLKYILDDLHLPTNSSGNVREDKWLTLPDMGHIIETCYNRAVVQLILLKEVYVRQIFQSEVLRRLTHNPTSCLGLIPDHFFHVFLKESCMLPPPCTEWSNNKIGEAEKWEFAFMDRQATFKDLMSKEPKPAKKPTNEHNPIFCDTPTPEKPKQELEVMEEDEDYALSHLLVLVTFSYKITLICLYDVFL